MAQVGEQVFVEALVAQAAIEALDEAVFNWHPRRDVMPLDLALLLPFQDGIRCQLRSVVADHHAGIAAHPGDVVEFTGNALSRQRSVHDRRQAFPAEVVDDTQHPETAPVREAVRHEVQRLSLVRPLWDRQRHPRSDRALATATLAHAQALFPVDPVELLPVHLPAFAAKKKMQPSIAEATPFAGKLLQPFPQLGVRRSG